MPKECKNEQCLFNGENPDGCPDVYKLCPICGSELKMKITEPTAEPELPTSSDMFTMDIEKRLLSSIFYEHPLIVFTTSMVKSDFEAIMGHLTIRFRSPKLGGFSTEMLFLERQDRLIDFKNTSYVILKGTLKLPQVILQYLDTEITFGIAYKYFLAEKEEQMPWVKGKFDRCLYLNKEHFEKKSYKYDIMPIHRTSNESTPIWRLSFNILANALTLDPTFQLTTFEEKVHSFKSITNQIFSSCYIKQSNSISCDFLPPDLCPSHKFPEQKREATTEWYLDLFHPPINPENFLKYLFLILLIYYNQELCSMEKAVFKKVYKCLRMDDIEFLISNKVHTVLIGMLQNREKSLQCLQKSFNATLFDKDISNTKVLIRLLPLYHYIFDTQRQLAYEHKHHNFTNNEYWGFPSNVSIKEFFREKEIDHFEYFINLMVTYDPIILDSIVLLTLNLKNIHDLSNIASIPIVSFVTAIIYRIKNWDCYQADSTLRNNAFTIIYTKLTSNAKSIIPTDLDELCDALFILWELTSKESFSEHYMTKDEVLLHLELTGKVLQIYDEIHPIRLQKADFEPQPCKHLKTSEELLNIVLKLLQKFLIVSNAEVKKILKRLEFWNRLFNIEFPKSYKWTDIVEKCFILLVQAICIEDIISVFIAMSKEQRFHEKMFYTFKDQIIDSVASGQHMNEQEKILRKLESISHNSPTVLMEILNTVLEQQKDFFKQDPTIHVLSWSPWSIIFKLQFTQKFENPHKEIQILLEEARDNFFVVVDELENTRIPIRILKHIARNQSSFFKIYELFDKAQLIQKDFIRELTETLEYFDDQFKCIKYFHYILNYANHLFECQEIKDFFRIDFESQPLNEVCLKNPGGEYFLVPQSLLAKKINTPEAKSIFKNSPNLKESTIFLNILKQIISSKYEFSQSIIVELATIYEELWWPAIIECEKLINELFTKTISLSNVEKHFRIYVEAEENMATDIDHICCVIEHIKSDVSYSQDLSRNSSRQVINYFKLHESCEFAVSINHVRNKYCPEGNFHEIDLLVKLKNIHFTDKNQLKVVSKELISLCSQLSKYDSYAKNLLDAFIDHPPFINWARTTLKDRDQLKVFVDLALASYGETDFDITRVTCLRSVCYHLAPLIFDLRPNSDCTEFLILYDVVLNQIVGGKKNFLNAFNETANLLHIWRHMTIAHTSVGKNAIGELTEILEKGIFQIKVDSYCDLGDIINLYLQESSSLNITYRLDSLKDLQSKIALIRADSQKKDGIELFTSLLENIIELSFLITKLNRIGHISYTKFLREYACSEENLFKLGREIEVGNKEYAEWSEELETARYQCDSLNYYTAMQIYILRRDLKALQYGSCDDPQIIHILSILHHEITIELIKETLDHISSNIIPKLDVSERTHENVQDPDQVQRTENDSLEPFPLEFSQQDRDICFSLQEQDVDFIRSIFAIKKFKQQSDNYEEFDILTFCLNNSEQIEFESSNKVDTHESNAVTSENIENDNYLSLEILIKFLEQIRENSPKVSRILPQTCKKGEPNLLFIPQYEIIYFLLSQYLDPETNNPFPDNQEVFICNPETSDEEIDIFMRRAIWELNSTSLFSMAFIEKLQYDVAVKCVSRLKLYARSTQSSSFKLLLICSSEYENSSYFTSALFKYKRIAPSTFDDNQLKIAILRNLSLQEVPVVPGNQDSLKPGCLIDPDKSYARIVTSNSVGAGKSLAIDRSISELKRLQGLPNNAVCSTCIPIYCGIIDDNEILNYLKLSEPEKREISWIYYFDIASTIGEELIPFLFKLLILGCLKDQNGNLWVCKKTDYYIIEMTQTSRNEQLHRFCNLLPKSFCLQPNLALSKMKSNAETTELTLDMKEFCSPCFQRIYTYLMKKELKDDLENFEFSEENKVKGCPVNFLEIVLKNCGMNDPSWSELSYFIRFLNQQLSVCEQNIYCRPSQMDKSWKGFKTFLINRMIPMSRDIATPSLISSLESSSRDLLDCYRIEPRRRWEENTQPYIYLNEDRQSMTFFGFKITKSLDLVDVFNSSKVIEKNSISRQLYLTLLHNRVDLEENCYNWDKEKKINVLANVMGIMKLDPDKPDTLIPIKDPDPTYVLTIDNMKKILAIHMRFRCNIPVIIMGETGCGKTRLIYYMCQLQSKHLDRKNMRVLKMHGGTTNDDIIKELEDSIELAKTNISQNIDTILFFDEANTSHSIGLIKEIMCDRRVNGKPIPNDIRLQFIAACNPYRRHSEQMLRKIHSSGLGSYNSHQETKEMFGNIPLRELVYRVVELPKSLRPLVWDFGQLNSDVEKSYIKEIIIKQLENSQSNIFNQDLVNRLSDILSVIQGYMRTRGDECSHVSLRDVERVMKVMLWFYKKMIIFSINFELNQLTTSFLLSLAICYRARLTYRRSFDATLVLHFQNPLKELKNEDIIGTEIERCQSAIVDSMKIGDHIAKNSALKENLFLMFVCIELRIPLFIIGKPGSSKSLAKTIISHSMDGEGSREDSKLKFFKQLHMLSYQCSQISTSEGILNLFTTCQKIQSREDPERFVACAVLDEVGLAEDSPSLPLKVLHPLLEDDTSYLGENTKCEKVAFIGLSNWALDPAKMNRGIMVCLEDPNQSELILSAKAICQSNSMSDLHSKKIIPFIKELVESYLALVMIQREKYHLEYFGLRDFYCLIKLLYQICMREDSQLNRLILYHAVKRNFGGLKDLDAFSIFEKRLHFREDTGKGPGSTPLELISSNLVSHQGSFYQKTRYLLLITENTAALDIIKQSKLVDIQDTRILFGSSFPNDLEYSTICRSINKIKNYMETGKTVILTNMLNLYESLYDVFNQYYLESLQRSWVDIGLGTHRVKCAVHEDFRLIVVADHSTTYTKFPSALINRLEKHILTVSTILSYEELKMANEIKLYALDFANVNTGPYKNKSKYVVGDCFVGFQEDTSAFIIYSHLNNPEELRLQESTKTIIREIALKTLLKMSTPDSILRLNDTKFNGEANSILQTYLTLPLQSLAEYLQFIMAHQHYFSQITTHSIVLMESEAIEIENSLSTEEYSVSVYVLYLLQFQTSQQFMSRIKEIMTKPIDRRKKVLLIQCENGHIHADLIACTRHRIMEEFTLMETNINCSIYVIIIVRLPRKTHSFASFCGSNWDTVHIEELRPPDLTILPQFQDLIHLSLSEIFAGKTSVKDSNNQTSKFNQCTRLCTTVQSALSLLVERKGSQVRTLKRIKQFITLLHDDSYRVISWKICEIISELLDHKNVPIYSKDWSRSAAFKEHLIQSAGTFRKALSKEIDIAIIPLVAETLAYLDRNGNIDLVFSDDKPALKDLWKCIFIDNYLLFNHSQAINPVISGDKIKVQVISDGWNGNFFQSGFPFSWIIVRSINELLNKMKTHSGRDILTDFETAFDQTPIGVSINSIIEIHKETPIASIYLDDFINLVIYPRDLLEHKAHYLLLLNTVLKLKGLHCGEDLVGASQSDTQNPDSSQLSIPMIHVAYKMLLNRITFVKQGYGLKFRGQKEIGVLIEDSMKNDPNGKLGEKIDSLIFKSILEECKPNLGDMSTKADWDLWYLKVRKFQPLIETNINIIFSNRETILSIKRAWNAIHTILIFVANFVLQSEYDMKAYLRQINTMVYAQNTDFDSPEILKRIFMVLNALTKKVNTEISTQLNITCIKCKRHPADVIALACLHYRCRNCYSHVKPESKCPDCENDIYAASIPSEREQHTIKCKEIVSKQNEFKAISTNFIMEFLSCITFATADTSEDDKGLIEYLIGYIAIDENALETLPDFEKNDISLFQEGILKPSATVRLFLLQLLIKTRFHSLRNKLFEYMELILKQVNRKEGSAAHEMILLFVQCFEDYFHSRYFTLPTESLKIEYISSYMTPNQTPNIFEPLTMHKDLTPAYIECVAILRFVVLTMCNSIFRIYDLQREALFILLNREKSSYFIEQIRAQIPNKFIVLLEMFKNLCLSVTCSEQIKTFILKSFYSHWGWGGLKSILSMQEFSWIMPSDESKHSSISHIPLDLFAAFGDDYLEARRAVHFLLGQDDVHSLTEFIDHQKLKKNNKIVQHRFIIFAIFTEGYLQYLKNNSTGVHIARYKIDNLSKFLNSKLGTMPSALNILITQLLENNLFNNRISEFILSPDSHGYIPTISSIYCHIGVLLHHALAEEKEKFLTPLTLIYSNPSKLKHKLFPTMENIESSSSSQVTVTEEGTWYQCPNGHPYLIDDCAKSLPIYTCSECGIAIESISHQMPGEAGDVVKKQDRGHLLGNPLERQPINVGLRRISATSVSIIRALMHAIFSWAACVKYYNNLQHLRELTEHVGEMEITKFYFLHLFIDIQDIAISTGRNFEEAALIVHMVIDAIINCEENIVNIDTVLTSNLLQESWEFFFDKYFITPILGSLDTMVGERMTHVRNDARVLNNTVLRSLYEKDSTSSQTEANLWRYRNIICFQHFKKTFNSQGLEKAVRYPLLARFIQGELILSATRFLPEIFRLQLKLSQREFLKMYEKMHATNTIQHFYDKIRDEEGQKAVEEYEFLINGFASAWILIGNDLIIQLGLDLKFQEVCIKETPLSFLLPNFLKDTSIIEASIKMLVNSHNSIIEEQKRCSFLPNNESMRDERINLNNVSPNNLINYHQQLDKLIISNARYSLQFGEGTRIEYDYMTIERQLVDKFISSKPYIIYLPRPNIATEDNIRAKIQRINELIPQDILGEEIRKKILTELPTIEKISEVLDLLEVVMGFAGSAGGFQNNKIQTYLHDVLKYPRGQDLLSETANINCCMKHIVSFWRVLSVEKSIIFVQHNQYPFSSFPEYLYRQLNIEQIKEFNNNINLLPLREILNELHDFIFFSLKSYNSTQADCPLYDCFKYYFKTEHNKDPANFPPRLFSKDIFVSHTIHVWTILAQET